MFARTRFILVTTLVALAALLVWAPNALGQSPTDTVEVVGQITSTTGGTTITVNGLTINIAGAERDVPIGVGAAVKVEGTLQADGVILARQVSAAEDDDLLPGEIEVIGTLAALSGMTATVDDFQFDLTSAEVEPGLATGALVKVHARRNESGVWAAREIERFDPRTRAMPDDHIAIPPEAECSQCHSDGRQALIDFDDDGLEITGTLDQVGPGFVVLGGQRYDTTGAELKGAMVAGTLVKLELMRQAGGTLVVREMKPAALGDLDDDRFDDDDDRDDDENELDDDRDEDDDEDDRDDDRDQDDSAEDDHDDDDDDDENGEDDDGDEGDDD